jgi:hypothetical protein
LFGGGHMTTELGLTDYLPDRLFGFRDPRVVLMEFVSHAIDRGIGMEVQNQIVGQDSGTVFPSLGQLLHLLAELGQRLDLTSLPLE